MRVEKEKRRVHIICNDQSLLTGFVHINQGERVIDFLNDDKETFIIVTNAEFQNVGNVHSFQLYNDLTKRRSVIVLNKSSVKWVEEI